MRTLRMVMLTVSLLSSVSSAQLPPLTNPGFEDGTAGWDMPPVTGRAAIVEGVAHSGARSLEVRTADQDTEVRQTLRDPGQRLMVLSAYFKADGVAIDKSPSRGEVEYARFYVHVLYKDRPYSDASHFYVDIPPGTYDWRRLAVQIRPRTDLVPAEMWISVAARFARGVLYADDIAIEPPQPFAGVDAAVWERAKDTIPISDMGACTPQDALADKRSKRHWKVLPYETATFSGRCISAGPETEAPPVTLALNATGWHAIILGLAGWPEGENVVRVKLTRDAAYQPRSQQTGVVEEVFFKCADLTGQSLHFAQQSAGYSRPAQVMYVKLVPLTAQEAQAVQQDAAQRETKRLVGTIDGFSFIYARRPTTKEELLEEFELYRGSDFGTIWWQYGGADQVNFKSKVGTIQGGDIDDAPLPGDRYYTEAVKELIARGVDITKVAVDACHDLGIDIYICMRPAAWELSPPFEDYFTSAFYRAHPEWRCYDRDGTPVARMSFAVPQVRQHLLDVFREVLKANPDGLNVLYSRGMPLILWENAFCKQFREKYGEDAKQVAEDDPRILALRAEIMTTWMREIRQLLDETQKANGLTKRLKLSAMLLETEADNRKFGLDAERWVRDGLLDQIGIYRGSSHTSGNPIDMAYYKRITAETNVPVCPGLVAWALPAAGEWVRQSVEWYDAGASGILVWDPSDKCQNGVEWPVLSRLGHLDEIRKQADQGMPTAVTLNLQRIGTAILGRWTTWAGF
jgi:hypothetical protein